MKRLKIGLLIHRARKLIAVLRNRTFRVVLFRHGVAAATEHCQCLAALDCSLVIDIGANRGQFSLVARWLFPGARIISFEPLPHPASIYEAIFAADKSAILHRFAIGPERGGTSFHVSGRDDSSSLLPIAPRQNELFPGTHEVHTITVQVAPLSMFLTPSEISRNALLKLDVQGFELQALMACADLLPKFKYIYAECSFVELYTDQALASSVIRWLDERGFLFVGIQNISYDSAGHSVQADFLFRNRFLSV